jgi:predicted DNA-binding transcriptional regulator
MNIIELEEKSKYALKDVTARTVAQDIMKEMKKHIGDKNPINRERLFNKVFGLKETELRPLNSYLLKELLYSAITYLRKNTHCFIVAKKTSKGWAYYIPTNMNELKTYKHYTAERIKSLEELERRAEESVKQKWYEEDWTL